MGETKLFKYVSHFTQIICLLIYTFHTNIHAQEKSNIGSFPELDYSKCQGAAAYVATCTETLDKVKANRQKFQEAVAKADDLGEQIRKQNQLCSGSYNNTKCAQALSSMVAERVAKIDEIKAISETIRKDLRELALKAAAERDREKKDLERASGIAAKCKKWQSDCKQSYILGYIVDCSTCQHPDAAWAKDTLSKHSLNFDDGEVPNVGSSSFLTPYLGAFEYSIGTTYDTQEGINKLERKYSDIGAQAATLEKQYTKSAADLKSMGETGTHPIRGESEITGSSPNNARNSNESSSPAPQSDSGSSAKNGSGSPSLSKQAQDPQPIQGNANRALANAIPDNQMAKNPTSEKSPSDSQKDLSANMKNGETTSANSGKIPDKFLDGKNQLYKNLPKGKIMENLKPADLASFLKLAPSKLDSEKNDRNSAAGNNSENKIKESKAIGLGSTGKGGSIGAKKAEGLPVVVASIDNGTGANSELGTPLAQDNLSPLQNRQVQSVGTPQSRPEDLFDTPLFARVNHCYTHLEERLNPD